MKQDEKYTGTEKEMNDDKVLGEDSAEMCKEENGVSEEIRDQNINALNDISDGADTENMEEVADEEKDQSFGSCTVDRLYALCGKFPEENVIADISTEAFRIFSSGRKGSPESVYAEFIGLKKAFGVFDGNKRSVVQNGHNEQCVGEEASQRAYSSYGSVNSYRDVSKGLTKRQMQMARESGMSFREYEELLNSISGAKRLR